MIKGKIKQIETMGLHDGPGVRIVIFFQGCPLRCLFCHNPEMWDYNADTKEYTPEELLTLIKRYQPYFGTEGGVTFSGGEPLGQSAFLKEIIKLCHQYNIHTVLDTSGSIINQDTQAIIDLVDLVILDIKALDNDSYHKMTGGSFSNFTKFLNYLQQKHKKIWIRVVIIPGINDNVEYIKQLAQYIKKLSMLERIELLPYHKMGDVKYEQAGINNPLKDYSAMDINKINELDKILKDEMQS